jgi:hypothetical protein
MTEFQQIRQQVGGRTIAIDSWYDAGRGTWRACAPAFSYLYYARPSSAPLRFASRVEAVERLVSLLNEHFSGRAN